MDRFEVLQLDHNGGFPQPPAGERVRVVFAPHDDCGGRTRVRLPAAVPARAVRHLRCKRCRNQFDPRRIDDYGVAHAGPAPAGPFAAARRRLELSNLTLPTLELPTRSLPKLELPKLSPPKLELPKLELPRFDPHGRFWRYLSIPLAACAVIAALIVLQGDDGSSFNRAVAPQAATAGQTAPGTGGGAGGSSGEAAGSDSGERPASKASPKTKLVRGTSYSLALPAGWERVSPLGGATFAATAPGGEADAQLWIEEDPKLDFPTFINQSLSQLEALAGSAQIVDRTPAPTPEATIVRLAADVPAGQPSYEVTLRVAGPFRYYLATSVQPDAPANAAKGAELIAGSFTPELEG